MYEIVAFGPHPDDVEIGLGGTLALHAARGERVAIVDLTRGEMGSAGTPEQRLAEGEAAARILGVSLRLNLGLPDRGLVCDAGAEGSGGEQLRRCVEAIRSLRPRVVAIPWREDMHPDHVAAHHLLTAAVFTAAMRKYETESPPHRVAQTVFYFINGGGEPSFLVDITPTWPKKIESLFAHQSQFGRAEGQPATRLNSPTGLLYLTESRNRFFGARIGVELAEGFITREPPLLGGL